MISKIKRDRFGAPALSQVRQISLVYKLRFIGVLSLPQRERLFVKPQFKKQALSE